jgi:ribulose-phosphate 3-epimerase
VTVQIAPSILSADFARLGDAVAAAERGGADLIHVDVMDGHFVPNITIGVPVVKSLKRIARVPLDVHLMIEDPDRYVEDFAKAGADIISVHVEACRHLHRVVQQIRGTGKRPAVVLNPASPLCLIEHVLGDVDMVLLMSVNPGFGGQAFIPSVVPKIRDLRRMLDERNLSNVEIEVDGGIKTDNVDVVTAVGGNVIVSGSGVFGAGPDYGKTIAAMRERGDQGAARR